MKLAQQLHIVNSSMTVLILAQQYKYTSIYGCIHTDTHTVFFLNAICMHIADYIHVVSPCHLMASMLHVLNFLPSYSPITQYCKIPKLFFLIGFCLYFTESSGTHYLLPFPDYLGVYVEQYRGQH